MSNKILVETQNFFVDTSKPPIGECRNATFVLPQGLMDCAEHQEMTVVLNSFSMAKNWYRVNQLNNVFYIVGLGVGDVGSRAISHTRVELTPGDYQFFQKQGFLRPRQESKSLGNQLEYQIQRALQSTHQTGAGSFATTVTFNTLTLRYEVTIDTIQARDSYINGIKLVCFTINTGTPIDWGGLVGEILTTPNFQVSVNVYAHAFTKFAANVDPNDPTVFELDISTPKTAPAVNDIITWVTNLKTYHASILAYRVNGVDPTLATIECSIASFGSALPTATELPVGTEIDFHKPINSAFIVEPGSTEHCVNLNWENAKTDAAAVAGTAKVQISNDYPEGVGGFSNNILNGYELILPGNTIRTPVAEIADFPNSGDPAVSTPILFALMNQPEPVLPGTVMELKITSPGNGDFSQPVGNTIVFASEFYVFPGMRATWSGQYPTNFAVASATYSAGQTVVTLDNSHQQSAATPVTFSLRVEIDATFLQKYGKIFLKAGVQPPALANTVVSWSGQATNSEHPLVTAQDNDWLNQAVPAGPIALITTSAYTTSTDRSKWFQIRDPLNNYGNASIAFRAPGTLNNPNAVSDSFQSTWEVLGGCYHDQGVLSGANETDYFNNLRAMFTFVPGANNFIQDFIAPFNACLQPEENIYLRTDLNNDNFQTPGFDTGLQTNVAGSQILAKIPLRNATFAGVNEYADPGGGGAGIVGTYEYERPYEIIFYSDNGNNKYSIMLSQKRVSQIRLFITDKYGRLIPEISPEQIHCGALSFAASLRIDVNERH